MNKKIISIQSTVLNNLVGNQAARYILMPRKYEFYEIPTIILTSHKAIKNSLNIPMSKLNPWIIFKNLKNIYNLSKNDLTIIGYLPDKKSTYSIDKILNNLTPINMIIDWELAYQFYKMDLNIHWTKKSIFYQGSKNNIYNSTLR